MAAGQLRQERQAAPRRARRPRRRALLRRPGRRPAAPGHHVDAGAAADAQHHGARPGARHRVVLRRPDPPLHDPGRLRPAAPTGRRTRTPPATRCTSTTCGSPRASPTATPPRCSPSCCPPARSTAATAPGWTWSATPPRRSTSSSSPSSPSTGTTPTSPTSRPTPAYATWSSPAATWPTCRGSSLESYLMRPAGDPDRSATSGWPPRRSMGLPQHWLQPDVVEGLERVARTAARRGVNLAIHTHVNHAQLADPAGRPGRPDGARGRRPRRPQPGRADARRQRHRARPARPVLRAAGRGRASCRTTSTCAT